MTKHLQTRVLPGGRIEISDPELRSGMVVDIYIRTEPRVSSADRPESALNILARSPGQRLFTTATAVDRHLTKERDGWDD